MEAECKLIELPAGCAILLAELMRFEVERECRCVEIRAQSAEFLSVCAMVGEVREFGEVRVRVSEDVREGCVRLVGLPPMLLATDGCQRTLIAENTEVSV